MTRLGIVGGGQLGRMTALAAANLGIDVGVLDPDEDAPAVRVAAFHVEGALDDPDAVRRLAERVDAVTFEWENVAPDALDGLPVPVHPGPAALRVTQDRLAEKRFVRAQGIGTADFEPVERDEGAIAAALERLGGRGVLKTRRLGYDGRGQARLPDLAPLAALEAVGPGELILEAWVPFDAELSVIGARGAEGTVCYDPGRNRHENGILRETVVPSGLPPALEGQAHHIAERLLVALDYRGVLGVEMFAVGDRLLVNELAPRVHNSGHWTDGGAVTSQFEQHVRAVMGLSLGSARRLADARMMNVLGDEIPEPSAHARTVIYGKREARPGRKMGHVTHLLPLS